MHKLLYCPTLGLTSLTPGNLEQNAQASRNCSSSGSLSSDDQACHNSDNFDSLKLYGQLSHNYSILVNHYNHPDVVYCTCYIVAIVQNLFEPIYFHLSYLDYWVSLFETQTFYHYVDFPLFEVDLVVTLPSTPSQYPNSNFYQSSSMIPVVSHAQ